jgi:DNA polymerase phi
MSSGSVALQLFWDLSSSDGAIRHASALKLTKALLLAHKAGGICAADGDGDSKTVSLRADGGTLSPEIVYAVKRLVKGLASSREGSREGFSLGLCQLLRSFPEIDGARVLDLIIESLPVKGGGMSDTEIKENNFGRLFGCMSLIRTGKCSASAGEWSAAIKADAEANMLCVKVLDELARLQNCKSFMAEATMHVASEMMTVALSDAPADAVAKVLLPRMRKSSEAVSVADMTPEQLQLLLFEQGLRAPGNAGCLKETEVSKLVEPLKKSTTSHPRLHAVWTQLISLVATFDGVKAKEHINTCRWAPASLSVLASVWTQVYQHEDTYISLNRHIHILKRRYTSMRTHT